MRLGGNKAPGVRQRRHAERADLIVADALQSISGGGGADLLQRLAEPALAVTRLQVMQNC